MNDPIISGGIGAMNTELSRFILDDSDMLFHIKKTMQGYELVIGSEGEMHYTLGKGRKYPDKVVHFVLDALTQVLNKNMKLSNYKDQEIQRTALQICDDFISNLWLNMANLNKGLDEEDRLQVTDISVLGAMFRNYVDEAIRRPLNESDKRFLKETTTETTQRVQQDITEQQNRGGFLGIFGNQRQR